MIKCKWCKRKVNETEIKEFTDIMGTTVNICESCYEKAVVGSTCIKCGKAVEPTMLMDGLCMSCSQIEMNRKAKEKEELLSGVDSTLASMVTSDMEFTQEDYEHWLTLRDDYRADGPYKNFARQSWILVKLSAAGITSETVQANDIESIETLLDRNLSKLIKNKCKLIIVNSAEARRSIFRDPDIGDNILDYDHNVYIIAESV